MFSNTIRLIYLYQVREYFETLHRDREALEELCACCLHTHVQTHTLLTQSFQGNLNKIPESPTNLILPAERSDGGIRYNLNLEICT